MSEYGAFIKCPDCGFEDQNSWEFGANSGEDECQDCEIELYIEVHVDVTYTTTLVKKEDKNE